MMPSSKTVSWYIMAILYHYFFAIAVGAKGSHSSEESGVVGDKPPFTELLVSARLKSIGLQLYFKDHALVRLMYRWPVIIQ